VQIDQSGAEALVVAYLCRHGNFRDLFLHGVKSHIYVALHAFKDVWAERFPEIWNPRFLASPIPKLDTIPNWDKMKKAIASSDHWPSEERYYYIAKMICHASNYGIEPFALQLNILIKSEGTIVLTLKQAKAFLDLYHSLFPEIREWHEEIKYKLDQHAELRNLFGFPRLFTSYRGTKEDLKEALAYIPQSTVGTITNQAIVSLQRTIEMDGCDWDILNNKHDSFLIQVPDGEVDEAVRVGNLAMNQEMTTPRGEVFRMKSGCEIGKNWGHYDKETNPEGLK
jgi:hypothetical protein